MDSQWLNKQFEISPKKTKAGLARALGLEPPAVSKMLNATRQIKAKEYVLMRTYFGMPVDGERALNSSELSEKSLKPLNEQSFLAHDSAKNGFDWVIPEAVLSQGTQAPPDKIKIFEISDSLMQPHFKVGEYVLVDLSDALPAPSGYFVISDGHSTFARQCEVLSIENAEHVLISAHDKKFQSQKLKITDIEIVGRVIAKLQWM